MERGKSLSTPLAPHLKLSKADCPKSDTEKAEMAKIPYASACGSLMYAMVATRPDIAYAVECGAISWLSQLQSCVRLSSTEAEYVAASEACKEAIWLTRLVGDLGIVREILVLHCDSQSAIQLARNPVFHAKTKHVDVRYHFIREVLEDKRLQLVKVHTDDNPADLLTKSLSSERFTHCRELMGIGEASS
ncbi:hypothetical protein L7F22_025647 [Adiantum nelumboides]|nr:hypothetical protein [Adiantum nelumboides]